MDAGVIKGFQRRILTWYKERGRELPWRRTTDPYKILVSEVMLQQTQVDRVLPYYERWLESFPDLKALASADRRSILQHWSGLGYNNRALRLQRCARVISHKHCSKFPQTEEELLELPGVGKYTARAVLAFAFNHGVAVVDTNIRRVLIYELKLSEEIPMMELEEIALRCVPPGGSREWHNALMDYGATVQTARRTGIGSLSRQDRFEGSTRQVRGGVLREVLKGDIPLESLRQRYPHPKFSDILEKMQEEGVLLLRDGNATVRNI